MSVANIFTDMPGFVTVSVANLFTDLPGCTNVLIYLLTCQQSFLFDLGSSPGMVRCTKTGIRENTLWAVGIARQYE
jgi:hypothetical protein